MFDKKVLMITGGTETFEKKFLRGSYQLMLVKFVYLVEMRKNKKKCESS